MDLENKCTAVLTGNSLYLVIPKDLRKKLGIKRGDEFFIFTTPEGLLYQKKEESG